MNTTPEKMRDRFAKDIASHKLTILRDDAVYRHVRGAKPGTGIMHFEIVTFPGYLVYVGDMGSFTFSRITDMFKFFRRDDGGINPGYWAEKVEAADRCDGIREFSREKFDENLFNDVRCCLGLEDGAEIPGSIEQDLREILDCDDNEHECMVAARDFEHETIDLSGYWEYNNQAFTHRFLWCCHAIVWAISEYDRMTRDCGMEVTES